MEYNVVSGMQKYFAGLDSITGQSARSQTVERALRNYLAQTPQNDPQSIWAYRGVLHESDPLTTRLKQSELYRKSTVPPQEVAVVPRQIQLKPKRVATTLDDLFAAAGISEDLVAKSQAIVDANAQANGTQGAATRVGIPSGEVRYLKSA